MFPLKLFLIILLLLHNANSRNYSRPPLPFPPGRIPQPSVVVSSVSSPDDEQETIIRISYPPRLPPTSKPTEDIGPSESADTTTEKIIIVYPIDQAPPLSITESTNGVQQKQQIPMYNSIPASQSSGFQSINRPPAPERKITPALPPLPPSGIPQYQSPSLSQTQPTQQPIFIARPISLQQSLPTTFPTPTMPSSTDTVVKRTTMQKYSTPFATRYKTKDGNFSPLSTTTQWSTTSLRPRTPSELMTPPTPQSTTTTLQPTTTISYSTSTTLQPTTTASHLTSTPSQATTTTPYSTTRTTQPSTTTTPYPTTTTQHITTSLKTMTPYSTQTSSQPSISTSQATTITPRPPPTSFKPIQTLVNFNCDRPNQYYATVNECDSYIECKEYVPVKKICPFGRQFKKDTIWPDYPCSYPSEANCAVGSVLQPTLPTVECPGKYGLYSVIDDDCSKYMMCQEGVGIIMNCPYGLVFNNITSSCDWPINVPSCNPEAFKNFKCPTPASEYYDTIFMYKYSNSCDNYIACQHGFPRLLSCDQGLSFDETAQACVESKYVTDCAVTNKIFK